MAEWRVMDKATGMSRMGMIAKSSSFSEFLHEEIMYQIRQETEECMYLGKGGSLQEKGGLRHSFH